MAAPITEADMFALLKRRCTKDAGNGPECVVVPGVRSDAGFNAKRTIDAVSMTLWPSRGLRLAAYEIKVSRSDWLAELKNPAKAEEFGPLVDEFWMVVADAKIIHGGELPHGWGLLAKRGNKLVQIQAASDLNGAGKELPPGFKRGFLAALLRQAARQGDAQPEAIRQAVDEARASEKLLREQESARLLQRAENAEERIRQFERGAGCSIGSLDKWSRSSPLEVGQAVKVVREGDATLKRYSERLAGLLEQADKVRDAIADSLAATTPTPDPEGEKQ